MLWLLLLSELIYYANGFLFNELFPYGHNFLHVIHNVIIKIATDMQLKNSSIIQSTSGCLLAPAYDLLNVAIINPQDKEESALTLVKKKSKLKRAHFETFGKRLGLTNRQVQSGFSCFCKKQEDALKWVNASF